LGMPWFCDLCGASGILDPGWCGTEAIGEHRRLSPDCPGGMSTVRCLPRFGEDRDRWKRLGKELMGREERSDG